MGLTLEGPGFVTEIDASPKSIYATGANCGHLGFSFADFSYAEHGSARVDVRGVQIGACLAPVGVQLEYDNKTLDLVADTIIIRTPGSISSSSWKQGFQGRFLVFSPETIERFFNSSLSKVVSASRDLVAPIGSQPTVTHLLAALGHDLANGNPGGPLLVESIGAAALRSIVRSVPSQLLRTVPRLSTTQAKILRDLIVERSAEALSLVDLATAVDLSVGHMLRAFKTTFGMTPYQYIIRERVECAVVFLKTTNMGFAEIAIECGFATPGQMARTFRSVLGAAPRDIKRG